MSDHAHTFPSLDAPTWSSRLMRLPTLPTFLVACLAAVLTFVMMRQTLVATWTTGAFVDTDDAMRLVQVRALLHGQPWFDMTAYALDPPHGTFMHWSRVVDVPIALLIKLFGLVANETQAERLARIAFPFALLVAFYLGMARLAGLLLGPIARIPAIFAALLSGDGIIQFLPGRIDHHAPRIVMLVFLLAAAVAALDPRRAREAVLAGVLIAVSLSISLENLPFIAIIIAMLVCLWIARGAILSPMLAWFAAGLLLGLPLMFVATVGPARYLLPVCDAFGAAHLGAGLIGAAGCGCLALGASSLASVRARLCAAACVAACAAAFVALAYPACLHEPFAAVDPLVRAIWLANVQESLPFPRLFQRDSSAALVSLVPVVLGLAGCVFAIATRTGVARHRFVVVTGVVAIGLALSFWQVRAFTSIAALATLGGVAVARAVRDLCRARGQDTLALIALALVYPFTATAVEVVLASDPAPLLAKGEVTQASCLAPQAFAPMRGLPPRLTLAPIDAGSFLLADTPHPVLAAAFHRDNDGNRFALDAMLAAPADAQKMLARRDVGYVMICAGLSETETLAKRAPDGLAAALLGHHAPAWLKPLPLDDTPFRVFEVIADMPAK